MTEQVKKDGVGFTPGPWIVDGDDIVERTGSLRGVYIGVGEPRGGGRLAETFANCLVTKDDECRANAHLIAASPELFEALERACALIEECAEELGAGPLSCIAAELKKYRSALSRARGEAKGE